MAVLANPTERHWAIYTLAHPETLEVRYVGVTHQSLKQRLREHLSHAYRNKRGRKNRRICWIRSLIASGLQPHMVVREEGVGNTWIQAEMRWIAHFRTLGARLVNATNGGEGTLGYSPSSETRRKLGEYARLRKGLKMSDTARQRMREAQLQRFAWEREMGIVRPPRTLSPETLQKMSEAQKGKKASDQTRRKLSEAHQNPSLETRKKLRQATLNRPVEQRQAFAKNRKGAKFTEEHKAKISAALKGRPRPREVMEKTWDARRGLKHSPETIAKIRESCKRHAAERRVRQ